MRLPRFSEGVIRRSTIPVGTGRGRITTASNEEPLPCGSTCSLTADTPCAANCPCTWNASANEYKCTIPNE